MKLFALSFCLIGSLLSAQDAPASAYTYEVTVTNLTKGQIFSPPLAVSHNKSIRLFEPGQPAIPALYLMAEDGDNGMLAALADESDLIWDAASAGGPLLPGQSVTLEVGGQFGFDNVSVLGMLVITNDTFFAVNGLEVPAFRFKTGFGRGVTVLADAYDAGSEANTESCDDIPGPPCGSGGVRVTDDAEGFIYISNGIHGIGDLSSADYDWRGPVARVRVRIRP